MHLKYLGDNYKVAHNFSSFEVKDQRGCVAVGHHVGACMDCRVLQRHLDWR